jgi:hypothetical protein
MTNHKLLNDACNFFFLVARVPPAPHLHPIGACVGTFDAVPEAHALPNKVTRQQKRPAFASGP